MMKTFLTSPEVKNGDITVLISDSSSINGPSSETLFCKIFIETSLAGGEGCGIETNFITSPLLNLGRCEVISRK